MMKLIIVGYAEEGNWYLLDDEGKEVEFEVDTLKNGGQLKEKYGIEEQP